MNTVALAAVILSGCVFAVSALSKLRRQAFAVFRASMRTTGLVPGPVAVALPVVEGLVGAGQLGVTAPSLALGRTSSLTMVVPLAGTVLAAVLCAGVVMIVRRRTVTRCACFGGSARRPLGPTHVGRNAVLVAASAVGLAGAATVHAPAPLAAVLLGTAVGAVGSLFLIFWEDVF